MSCYNTLVNNNFLDNIDSELSQARLYIRELDSAIMYRDNTHLFNKEANKNLYYDLCDGLGFFDTLYDTLDDFMGVSYVSYDRYIFSYSRSKTSLKHDITYCNRVNGDIPLFTCKHVINGKTVHTALYDTSFTIPPPTPN